MTDRVTEKHKMSYIIHKKPLKKSNKNGILTSEIRNFKKKIGLKEIRYIWLNSISKRLQEISPREASPDNGRG